jgi:hypothetical protein
MSWTTTEALQHRFLYGKWPTKPTLTTIKGIRFPADGTPPHVVPLTTMIPSADGHADCAWGHVPDLRSFWKTEQPWPWSLSKPDPAWQKRDFCIFRMDHQPLSSCNGLYVVFFSYDTATLPQHSYFPEAIFQRRLRLAGDTFVVKLQGTEIGEDLGKDGFAAWLDVPEEILTLPVMKIWGKEAVPSGVGQL